MKISTVFSVFIVFIMTMAVFVPADGAGIFPVLTDDGPGISVPAKAHRLTVSAYAAGSPDNLKIVGSDPQKMIAMMTPSARQKIDKAASGFVRSVDELRNANKFDLLMSEKIGRYFANVNREQNMILSAAVLFRGIEIMDRDARQTRTELGKISKIKKQLQEKIDEINARRGVKAKRISTGNAKRELDALRIKLDGLNEMSEMTALRLRMTMDRRSKFIRTLSSIMKKIANCNAELVQNIK